VSSGSIISGVVRNSVIASNVVVRSWSTIEEAVVFQGVEVGRYSKIKKAIIDKNNIIPPRTTIGCDPDEDKKRFTVTPRGITVVPKGYF